MEEQQYNAYSMPHQSLFLSEHRAFHEKHDRETATRMQITEAARLAASGVNVVFIAHNSHMISTHMQQLRFCPHITGLIQYKMHEYRAELSNGAWIKFTTMHENGIDAIRGMRRCMIIPEHLLFSKPASLFQNNLTRFEQRVLDFMIHNNTMFKANGATGGVVDKVDFTTDSAVVNRLVAAAGFISVSDIINEDNIVSGPEEPNAKEMSPAGRFEDHGQVMLEIANKMLPTPEVQNARARLQEALFWMRGEEK